jgi:hypothetical protein
MRPPGSATTLATLAALLLLTALVYRPGLDGPALLDDRHNLAPLAQVATGRLPLRDYLLEPGAGGLPRALPRATFWLDWQRHADAVRGYKLTNLLLHLLCAALLYALVVRVLAGMPTTLPAPVLALFVTATWLLSPLLVSTVLYVVQRMAQLAALFCLLSLYCYVVARQARQAGLRITAFAVAGLSAVLAMLSKQNAVVLLPMLWLTEHFVLRGPFDSPRARHLLLGVMAAGLIAFGMTVWWQPEWLLEAYAARDFTPWQRLLTQPRALLDYAGNLLLWPLARPMGPFHDDLVASTGALSPPMTAPALAVLVAAVVFILRTRAARLATCALGLGWFLAAHAVESSVFGLELYFEHRNYLPAVGLFLGVAGVADVLYQRARRRILVPALMLVLVLASAALTALRVDLWRSELTLYTAAVRQHPGSARAHLGLSALYFNAGDATRGRQALNAAAALLPASAGFGLALNALAPYCSSDDPAPAWTHQRFTRAMTLGDDFYTINAIAWLAAALDRDQCHPRDRAMLARTLQRLAPTRGRARTQEREYARERHLARLARALDLAPLPPPR